MCVVAHCTWQTCIHALIIRQYSIQCRTRNTRMQLSSSTPRTVWRATATVCDATTPIIPLVSTLHMRCVVPLWHFELINICSPAVVVAAILPVQTSFPPLVMMPQFAIVTFLPASCTSFRKTVYDSQLRRLLFCSGVVQWREGLQHFGLGSSAAGLRRGRRVRWQRGEQK